MSGLYSDLYNSKSGIQTEESITHSLPGANTKVAKMKKLNIFSGANKKSSYSRANSSPVSPPGIHTLVSKKEEEKLKWQKEQEEFNRRKREHEIQLVEIERQEVERREEEVRRRNEDLDEKRRKHRMIQDAVSEQIKTLNHKLEEYRMDHKKEEEDLEDQIASMEDRLAEVKSDLESRMRDLEITFEEDDSPSKASTVKVDTSPFSIPSAPMSSDINHSPPPMSVSYPKLSMTEGMLSMDDVDHPTSRSMFNQHNSNSMSQGNMRRPAPRQFPSSQGGGTSVGSSPLSSHSESSRSITPKTDQTDADNCV